MAMFLLHKTNVEEIEKQTKAFFGMARWAKENIIWLSGNLCADLGKKEAWGSRILDCLISACFASGGGGLRLRKDPGKFL